MTSTFESAVACRTGRGAQRVHGECEEALTCERDRGRQAEERGLSGGLCVCGDSRAAVLRLWTLYGQRVCLQLTERNSVCARRKSSACGTHSDTLSKPSRAARTKHSPAPGLVTARFWPGKTSHRKMRWSFLNLVWI